MYFFNCTCNRISGGVNIDFISADCKLLYEYFISLTIALITFRFYENFAIIYSAILS